MRLESQDGYSYCNYETLHAFFFNFKRTLGCFTVDEFLNLSDDRFTCFSYLEHYRKQGVQVLLRAVILRVQFKTRDPSFIHQIYPPIFKEISVLLPTSV